MLPLWPFMLFSLLMILLVLGKWDRDRGSQGSYDRVARIYLILGSKHWEPIDGTQVKRVIKMRAERDESDPFAMIAFVNISIAATARETRSSNGQVTDID